MLDIDALSIKNFRGIGNQEQVIFGFKKINTFIGQNNSGKSTFLRLISQYFPLRMQSGDCHLKNKFDEIDRNRDDDRTPYLGLAISSDRLIDSIIERFPGDGSQIWPNIVKNVVARLVDERDLVWWDYDLASVGAPSIRLGDLSRFASSSDMQPFAQFMTKTTGYGGGGPEAWLQHSIAVIQKFCPTFGPTTHLIPAIRNISGKEIHFSENDLSGKGLINRLAEIQNPDLEKRKDVEKFRKINRFLKELVGFEDAEIEIPNSKNYILVHLNGRTLPLSSLGTGIEELIIMVAFCTLISRSVICIEEPEIHLHPNLQRKFIKYLENDTSNTYFIATHSPAIIDSKNSASFRVALDKNKTIIAPIIIDRDRHDICFDLGYRPSDLVQANFMIWVEGPTERIYLNHWIREAAPGLQEGLHYSIFFYGGRLLSHLSAGDDDVGDIIKLRAINRNIALLMDSDRSSKFSKLNKTKKRIFDEISDHGGFPWITAGREIENYVPLKMINEALEHVHSSIFVRPIESGRYDHAFYFYAKRGGKEIVYESADKVKLARYVTGKPADLNVLDLREKITGLVAAIKLANKS